MRLALEEAWKYQLLTYPNPTVGATVLHKGRIVAVEAHQKAGTSHAEVLALLAAYETMTNESVDFDKFDALKAHDFLLSLPAGFFAEYSLYVTLEPCAHEGKTPSCASLLSRLKPKEVIFGIDDPVEGHGGGIERLRQAGIAVRRGVLEEACRVLIEPFLIAQKRTFVLFKLAQTLNGKIGGGVISGKASHRHTHRLRAVCDRLLIGGNTVREDRPRLDCRYIDAPPPDIYIYSKRTTWDKTIPLFGIEGREVNIGDSLAFLERPGFVLVEGGEGMLHALHDRIDWTLHYLSPKLSSNQISYNIDTQTQFLHHASCGEDVMLWSRWLGHRKTGR